MRRWHLVGYDVRDEARLRKVARLVEGYGERVQFSVFRCRLTHTELERLKWELTGVTEAEDRVLVIPLCEHCAGNVQGLAEGTPWETKPSTFRVV